MGEFFYGSLCVFLLSLLSACGHLNNKAECPLTHGISCRPMHAIDAMVDEGYFGKKAAQPSRMKASSYRQHTVSQRVWVAPYEDPSGQYRGGHYVY